MKRPVLLLTVFLLAVTIVGLTAMVDHSIYASDRDQPWISCSAVMEAGESYSRSIDIVIYNQTGSPIAVDYCGTTDPEQLVLCSVGFYPANHGGDGTYRCEAHFVQDSGLSGPGAVEIDDQCTAIIVPTGVHGDPCD